MEGVEVSHVTMLPSKALQTVLIRRNT